MGECYVCGKETNGKTGDLPICIGCYATGSEANLTRITNLESMLKIAKEALEDIAGGIDCGCCKQDEPYCDVGIAREALAEIARKLEGQ